VSRGRRRGQPGIESRKKSRLGASPQSPSSPAARRARVRGAPLCQQRAWQVLCTGAMPPPPNGSSAPPNGSASGTCATLTPILSTRTHAPQQEGGAPPGRWRRVATRDWKGGGANEREGARPRETSLSRCDALDCFALKTRAGPPAPAHASQYGSECVRERSVGRGPY